MVISCSKRKLYWNSQVRFQDTHGGHIFQWEKSHSWIWLSLLLPPSKQMIRIRTWLRPVFSSPSWWLGSQVLLKNTFCIWEFSSHLTCWLKGKYHTEVLSLCQGLLSNLPENSGLQVICFWQMVKCTLISRFSLSYVYIYPIGNHKVGGMQMVVRI